MSGDVTISPIDMPVVSATYNVILPAIFRVKIKGINSFGVVFGTALINRVVLLTTCTTVWLDAKPLLIIVMPSSIPAVSITFKVVPLLPIGL